MQKVTRTGISLNPKLLKLFDELIKEKGYTNRSEAIEDIIREYVKSEKEKDKIAIIKVIYDHRLGHFNDKITKLQHEYHCLVSSMLRNYLSSHNCLEIMVIKGKKISINNFFNKIKNIKGVKSFHIFYLNKDI